MCADPHHPHHQDGQVLGFTCRPAEFAGPQGGNHHELLYPRCLRSLDQIDGAVPIDGLHVGEGVEKVALRRTHCTDHL